MGRKGKTPKIDQTLSIAKRLGLSAEEATIANDLARLSVTAPTTLCTEHVPNEERPLECAKCGKPIGNAFDKAASDARQSELRFEKHIGLPLESAFTEDEWADITTAAERDAPLCAVLTPDQLAAALDGVVADESSNLGRETRATDDGPAYEPTIRGILLEPLWSMRLSILAKEEGSSETDYVQFLIRRQWVARGKGG